MGLSFLCKTVTLHFRQIFCVMKCSSKILFTDFTFALVVPSLYHLEIHDLHSGSSPGSPPFHAHTPIFVRKWGF